MSFYLFIAISFYRNIEILCAEMSRVNKALGRNLWSVTTHFRFRKWNKLRFILQWKSSIFRSWWSYCQSCVIVDAQRWGRRPRNLVSSRGRTNQRRQKSKRSNRQCRDGRKERRELWWGRREWGLWFCSRSDHFWCWPDFLTWSQINRMGRTGGCFSADARFSPESAPDGIHLVSNGFNVKCLQFGLGQFLRESR